jgi:hypothetical protein
MAGSVTAAADSVRRLISDNAAMTLLRADLLPVSAAILGTILDNPPVTMDVAEFLERADDGLDQLRDIGVDAPQAAQAYLTTWIGQGLIARQPGQGRMETVRLSPAALDAMDFLRRLEHPQSTVTSSRLATVTGLLRRLARSTDPSQEARLADLRSRRDALDAEIARVEAGHIDVLDDTAARQDLAEILRLAGQIPADFTKVSTDLERLNHDLRQQIIVSTGSRGDVWTRSSPESTSSTTPRPGAPSPPSTSCSPISRPPRPSTSRSTRSSTGPGPTASPSTTASSCAGCSASSRTTRRRCAG